MDCPEAQATILESLDEPVRSTGSVPLRAHVAGCSACEEFEAAQHNLDRRLNALLVPPEISLAFTADLNRRIREERKPWSTALPDVVHLVSCGAATIFCAAILPFDLSLTLGVGLAATSATYLLLTAVRDTLERAEESAP